ncbi:glycosyltransferase family 2 protein [Arthrobacter sp. TMT4-20]
MSEKKDPVRFLVLGSSEDMPAMSPTVARLVDILEGSLVTLVAYGSGDLSPIGDLSVEYSTGLLSLPTVHSPAAAINFACAETDKAFFVVLEAGTILNAAGIGFLKTAGMSQTEAVYVVLDNDQDDKSVAKGLGDEHPRLNGVAAGGRVLGSGFAKTIWAEAGGFGDTAQGGLDCLQFIKNCKLEGYRTVSSMPPSRGTRLVVPEDDSLQLSNARSADILSKAFKEKPRPMVSVVIATRNRAQMLVESIKSVLLQSFLDTEIIIVDDGSTDDTRQVVQEMTDPRLRYFYQSARGISSARNLGSDQALGRYIAVHDDDDLMLPWRLERQVEALEEGSQGVYGSFVNFDDGNGDLVFHHGRNFTYGAAFMTGFAPGHSTWLIEADLLRMLRYDESLESAVDNNLAFRLLRSGAHLVHSGVVCCLRRVHSRRITDVGGGGQKTGAAFNLIYLSSRISEEQKKTQMDAAKFDWGKVPGRKTYIEDLTPFLPDHLVSRRVSVADAANVEGLPGKPSSSAIFYNGDDVITNMVLEYDAISWQDFMRLASSGINYTVSAELRVVNLDSHPTPDIETDRWPEATRQNIKHALSQQTLEDAPRYLVLAQISETENGRILFGEAHAVSYSVMTKNLESERMYYFTVGTFESAIRLRTEIGRVAGNAKCTIVRPRLSPLLDPSELSAITKENEVK